ncbi:MAG: tRNA 4-thiouridine(8) synthase ThiI [bacterium]|nr:tRNA 4-thiouridine(8) synthase ThiI [bacterium]
MNDTENLILIHYHEIGLKGKNRGRFERQLQSNINRALKGLSRGPVQRLYGRIILKLKPDSPIGVIRDRLTGISGIANFSEAIRVPKEIEIIRETAWAVAQKATFESFRITTKRGDKSFPMLSEEVNRDVGAYIQERLNARVQLVGPDLTCYIEITQEDVFIYAEKVSGPGGLPVGTGERALSLLSSGLDSPVASYKMIKRGVRLSFVHFHSQPYTNRNSQRNTEELVRLLTQYQFKSTLYLVPFVEIQRHIMRNAPENYRVILYRRFMFRIAETQANQEGALALVTGESVGQVASQTLANIKAIEEVTLLPVLRPLAGDNKDEIIDEARRIGTYDISIEPYEDCCSVFVPKHPETRADLEKVHKIEAELELDEILRQTLRQTEVKTFKL